MIVTLLTDYGRDDDFVGVCHGVIAAIAPDARIVDMTHGIAPLRRAPRRARAAQHAALHAASACTWRWWTRRWAPSAARVALRCRGRPHAGGARQRAAVAWPGSAPAAWTLAVDVTRSPHRLEPVSATFHGRDVFAPVAAHLAAGAELADAGDAARARTSWSGWSCPSRATEDGALVAHVLVVDRFGNVGARRGPRGPGRAPASRSASTVEIEVGGRALPRHLRAHLRRRARPAS